MLATLVCIAWTAGTISHSSVAMTLVHLPLFRRHRATSAAGAGSAWQAACWGARARAGQGRRRTVGLHVDVRYGALVLSQRPRSQHQERAAGVGGAGPAASGPHLPAAPGALGLLGSLRALAPVRTPRGLPAASERRPKRSEV